MIPLPIVISAVALMGGALSARWNWWRRPRPGIPILLYHKVGRPPAGSKLKSLWVSPDAFRRQMSHLSKHNYQAVTFKDLTNHWDGIAPLPEKPVIITFDDGYQNNFTEAFPILREFGFRATVFVVVQTVGWDNRWHDPHSETRIPMITWGQLKELQKAGWEIGSHTMNHPRLLNIEKKEVVTELEKSRRVIGDFLDQMPQTFAYPYGNGEDDAVIRSMVKEAGYRIAVGIHAGKWTMDQIKASPANLPRIFIRGDENNLDFHLQLTRGRSRF